MVSSDIINIQLPLDKLLDQVLLLNLNKKVPIHAKEHFVIMRMFMLKITLFIMLNH